MRFSIRELSALVKMAIAIGSADDNLDNKEMAIITKELLNFNCTLDEATYIAQQAESLEVDEAFRIISSFDSDQKKYATGFLAAVILADGSIKDDEIKAWQLICTLAKFPTMGMGDALEFWKNH